MFTGDQVFRIGKVIYRVLLKYSFLHMGLQVQCSKLLNHPFNLLNLQEKFRQ